MAAVCFFFFSSTTSASSSSSSSSPSPSSPSPSSSSSSDSPPRVWRWNPLPFTAAPSATPPLRLAGALFSYSDQSHNKIVLKNSKIEKKKKERKNTFKKI
jgi:hypothetical protein